MIENCLKIKEDREERIDVSKFPKTLAFLKLQSVGYEPKKLKVFTKDDITNMVNASDHMNGLVVRLY